MADLQSHLVSTIDRRVKAGERRDIHILHFNIHAGRTNVRNEVQQAVDINRIANVVKKKNEKRGILDVLFGTEEDDYGALN